MVPGTNLNPCISLHTSWHGKGRATFVPFLTHFQEDKRSIQVYLLSSSLPACLPQGKTLYVRTTSCLLWHRSNMMTVIGPTVSVKHVLEIFRVLLNAAKTDTPQDSQGFGQFYLYASLYNTNFHKMKRSFSSQNIHEILLEYASLCTSLTMLSASGHMARTVLLSRCQSCFSLD